LAGGGYLIWTVVTNFGEEEAGIEQKTRKSQIKKSTHMHTVKPWAKWETVSVATRKRVDLVVVGGNKTWGEK